MENEKWKMKNEKLRIIHYPLSIFHYSLPLAIIDFPPHCGLDPQSPAAIVKGQKYSVKGLLCSSLSSARE